ncbi:arginine deiminase [Maribellus maritimus]|uniref:arginine deiminase n=1 Tax=Maribellus maritimus TaxID=2870838 RepID=UPI001EECB9CC|nr:arginine deiminase family protein [Maribellus maritimus]MCG6185990.1 arginine deiminase [Maribellus maritimus]
MQTSINSEIGKLEGVVVHTPGAEVENMTPENAERALYSDILNLSIASREYAQMIGVLRKTTQVLEVKKLLSDILKNDTCKEQLLKDVCVHEQIPGLADELLQHKEEDLAALLTEGLILEKNNLTNYLNNERFLLRPLHNLFFTRDSAMGMNQSMLIGKMANPVRERETLIMEAIFKNHPVFETQVVNPLNNKSSILKSAQIKIEGGDFQVARPDVFVIGTGMRTSTQGIDFIIEHIKQQKKEPHHIIVQELPSTPESFIHLDMIFTFLDVDTCMAYDPVIFGTSRFRTIHIQIENGKVIKIGEEANIPSALRKLGIDLKSVSCGGKEDLWVQEREQWHSGANFFALAPGKVIGYERNVHTVEELNKNGFEVLKATDLIENKVSIDDYKKCIITIAGSELARGGGGARCMTMPVRRAEVSW